MAADTIKGNIEVLKQSNDTALTSLGSETSKSPVDGNHEVKADASLVGTMQALTNFTGTVIKGENSSYSCENTSTPEDPDPNNDDDDTTDTDPFSTSFGGGLIGGSLVAYIAASTVDQQKALLGISSQYLYQYGLSIEASNNSALAQSEISKDAADQQFLASMDDAYVSFTNGICSAATAAYTIGSYTKSATGRKLSAANTKKENAEKLQTALNDPETTKGIKASHEIGDYGSIDKSKRVSGSEHRKVTGGEPLDNTKEYTVTELDDKGKLVVDGSGNPTGATITLKGDEIDAANAEYDKNETASIKENIIANGTVEPGTLENPNTQRAIKEIQSNPADLKEALKNTRNNHGEAVSEIHSVTQDIQWRTTLAQAISGGVSGIADGFIKIDQAYHAKLAEKERAAAQVYGTSSSSLAQVGGMYSSGASTLVQQANSELSSVMDAARRASTRN
jgi:hypothetical protein